MDGPLLTIFSHAMELPESQRCSYLQSACGGDDDLRNKIERLLRHGPTLATDLLFGKAGFSLLTTPSEILPMQLERYELQARIGEGAFGVVYRAVQHTPVKRAVAVKVLRPGLESAQIVARFEAERQVLAGLDHPNVARLFDAGNMPDGRPFFVMEFLDGLPLTDYCDNRHLDLQARLRLFLEVCAGVEHAHRRGILHRDLKPSNILAYELDGVAQVKVIDFGIARALETETPLGSLATEAGRLIGTPEYMSPEQIDGDSSGVDTRADVYALGVILYELLCGRLPFASKHLRSSRLSELRRIICEETPPPPSAAWEDDARGLELAAANRGTTPAALEQSLKREIEWVPLRALRKLSSDRYNGTSAFAEDVNNYLTGKPLLAGPDSAAYRARKFVQRHRPTVATAVAIFALLVIAVVGTTLEMMSARRSQAKADAARDTAELRLAETKLVSGQYATDQSKFVDAWDSFVAAREIEVMHGNPTLPADFGLYGVLAKADPPAAILQSSETGMPWVKFVDGGNTLISSGPSRSIEWDLNSSRRMREFPAKIVAVSPDEKTIFLRDDAYTIVSRDRHTYAQRIAFEHDAGDKFGRFTVSPDGRLLVGCHIYNYFSVWDTATGKRIAKRKVSDDQVHNVVFNKAGSRAYFGCGEDSPSAWDTTTWKQIGTLPHTRGGLIDITVSPDGKKLATAGWPRQPLVIDLESEQITRTFPLQESEINAIAFSPDGASLVSCGADASVRTNDVSSGQLKRFQLGHRTPVEAVAYSADGQRFATASLDGEIRVWEANPQRVAFEIPYDHRKSVYELPFSSDDRFFVPMPVRQTGEAAVWDTEARKQIATLDLTDITLGTGIHFTAASDHIFAVQDGESPGTLFEWDIASGHRRALIDLGFLIRGISFDSDGKRMVAFGDSAGVMVLDLTNNRLLWKRDNPMKSWSFSEISPDGKHVAIETNDGNIEIVRAEDGKTIRKIKTIANPIGFASVSFVPGHADELVWTHELDSRPRLVNFITGEQIWIAGDLQHENSSWWYMTADGKMIALASDNRRIDFIDTNDGHELFDVVLPEAVTRQLLSPHMTKLAYLSLDNRLWIADLTIGSRLATAAQMHATEGK